MYFYRPQTKFAKVMFLTCLSVILFTRGWVCLSTCWDAYPPGPEAGTPPGPEASPPPSGPEADPPQSSVCWEIRATRGRYASYWNAYLFFFKIWRISVLFVGPLIPLLGLLVMCALGFKARVDPLLACLIACGQWIPQIHLWCYTC